MLGTIFPGEKLVPKKPLCVQKPAFWLVGQWTRIMLATPPDWGRLDVSFPEELVLLDRSRYEEGETTQKFYFRAIAPLKSGKLVFNSGKYKLAVPIRVLSWAEALEGHFTVKIDTGWTWQGKLQLPRVFPLDLRDGPKSGVSFVEQQKLEQEKQNYQRNLRARAIKALPEVESLEKLFYALPESTIPRATYLNHLFYQKVKDPKKGCPICGEKVFKGRHAFYPWLLDPENHPYQIQCPECGQWFPTNKFPEGDMTSGKFPDDGWGYFDEEGRPYAFIGYYALWYYKAYYKPLPWRYSVYYLATGDSCFARATAVVLFRIAEQFLNLALNINQRNRYTREALWAGRLPPKSPPPSHSTWFASGFYMDEVCSISPDIQFATAFERIWDYFNKDDRVLLDFLQKHYHPEIRTMEDVRRFIVTGYFRTVAQGLLDYAVHGNGPAEHSMALRLALFLNTPRSVDLVRWVINNPKHGMRYCLTNYFFKDGSGFESPGYNRGHYRSTREIADLLERLRRLHPQRYSRAEFSFLADDPKFRYIYDHNIAMSLISRTYANVGDDGDLAYTDPLLLRPGASLMRGEWARAFRRWHDDVNIAKALWDDTKKAAVKELRNPSLRARVKSIIERQGPYLNLPSQVLDGYGHAILRSGIAEHQRALWLRYGRMYGHMHHDTLTIGYEALRRTLLPEQGYHRGPDFRTEWDMNWAIHYCGRIVGASSEPEEEWGSQGRPGGALEVFADGG